MSLSVVTAPLSAGDEDGEDSGEGVDEAPISLDIQAESPDIQSPVIPDVQEGSGDDDSPSPLDLDIDFEPTLF